MSKKIDIRTITRGYLIALAVATVLLSCSKDDVVKDPVVIQETQTPIGFSVHKQNITRAVSLETLRHYNFGVWAWAVQSLKSQADVEQMSNYLVGYSDGVSKGYDKTGPRPGPVRLTLHQENLPLVL